MNGKQNESDEALGNEGSGNKEQVEEVRQDIPLLVVVYMNDHLMFDLM